MRLVRRDAGGLTRGLMGTTLGVEANGTAGSFRFVDHDADILNAQAKLQKRESPSTE